MTSTVTRVSFGRLRVGVIGLMLLGAAAFVATLVPGVRSHPGFDPTYDAWVQGGAYVCCALSAVVPVVLRRRERGFWALVGASVVLRTAGFLIYWAWVRTLVPQPSFSLSDACWLASDLALVGAVTLALRRVAPVMSQMMFLDALIAALTAASYSFALLGPTLDRLTASGDPTMVVLINMTYPVIDVALVALVAGLLVWVRGDTSWASRLVLLGFLMIAAVDCIFLYEVTAGTWRAGTWVSGLSMVAIVLMSTAAWLAPPSREVDKRIARAPHAPLQTPIAFALLCTAIFVLDAFHDQPRATVLLAAGATLLSIIRGARTFNTDRRESRRVIRVSEDERTKLQALVETSGDFIAIAGLDGRLEYINPAGRRMVRLSPRVDVRRTSMSDFLTEEGQRTLREVEQPGMAAEGHWEGESTLKDQRTGAAIPVAISSFLMKHPETGEPMAVATVQRDITERVAAEAELAALAEQRQLLLGRLVQAEEAERTRIAADVHDDSVQALAVVDLRLGLLRSELADLPAGHLRALDALRDSVGQAIGRLRELLFDLEPPGGEVDLGSALADAAGHLFEGTGVTWEVTGDGGPDLTQSTRVTAYRIGKEALVNVLKHAQARRVEIRVETSSARGGLRMSVVDDGVGFGDDARLDRPGHLGLDGMADRATIAGGRLEVDSAPGRGTTVSLWLPDAKDGSRAVEG